MTTEELENYVPKGQLIGFPKEIIARMIDCQEEQGNKRDISVFEERASAGCIYKGFDWDKAKEAGHFWFKVIKEKDFNLFFKKYPKQDNQDNFQEFNLENYEPKGELIGFPKEVIKRILDYQEEQGNKRNITVFEENKFSGKAEGGFDWNKTKEENVFWHEVITKEDFDLFFKKYPKQDNQYNSQEFKVGDEVIDIIRGRRGKVIHILSGIKGKVTDINTLNKDDSIFVDFNEHDTTGFTLDGRYYSLDKYPRLLHYRNDYDYSVIDFNNLPQRQELKRWRAKVEETYYSLSSNFKIEQHYEDNDSFNDEAYDSGNYFQTKEQAQEVVDKLKEYFNQLINK